jgi:hypothetical protein
MAKGTKAPLSGLLIRAIDKDLLFDDLLGSTVTGKDGSFEIEYRGSDFQELFDKRPDIFLEVYRTSGSVSDGSFEDRPIFTTESSVRFGSTRSERFLIEIDEAFVGTHLTEGPE